MDPNDRKELDELQIAQKALREQLEKVEQQVKALCQKMESPAPKAPQIAPPPLPAVAPHFSHSSQNSHASQPESGTELTRLTRLTSRPEPPPEPAKSPEGSLEIQIGRVWLVRVGVAMLLTGLVFLGNFFIARIGPAGKLLMLFSTGGALAGLGAWLERGKPALRNYSRVLLGGGLATIYYAAYAAHFVSRLRVIQSPLIGGILLLALAGIIGVVAERKQSQTLALFAVLLSYYTSAINPIAGFTLYSNLLLTGAAVLLMLRNQWVALSVASLLATYLSYGYWQFLRAWEFPFRWEFSQADFWHGTLFLSAYFSLFTAATFLCRYERFSRGRRTGFLSLNNAAFFLYVGPYVAHVYPGSFWCFCMGFGAVLLGLAALATRLLSEETFSDAAYLAQGLLLVTVGIVSKLAGFQLALVLAVESAILVACCRQRHSWLWQLAAALCAGVSFAKTLDTLFGDPSRTLLLGGACGLVFLFCARWTKHLTKTEGRFNGVSAYYSGLALILGVLIMWDQAGGAEGEPNALAGIALSLAVVGALLTFTVWLHGLLELAVLAQFYVFGSVGLLLGTADWATIVWWNPAIVLGVILATASRWRRRDQPWLQGLYALAVVVLLQFWLEARFSSQSWMLVAAVLAGTLLWYGKKTGFVALGILGQWFVAASALTFFTGVAEPASGWGFSLACVGGIALLARAVAGIVPEPFKEFAPAIGDIYRVLALAMFLRWGFHFIAPPHQFLCFVFGGFLLFLAGILTRNCSRMAFCGILAGTGVGVFWLGDRPLEVASQGTAILLLLVAQQLAWRSRRFEPPGEGQGSALSAPRAPSRSIEQGLVLVGLASLWLLASRWAGAREFSCTIVWSGLAALVFGAGIGIRERLYRLAGLGILGLALARVFLVDVWQFGTVTRIASFIVLGLALLLVGFLYNRLEDKIRQWL
jgi:uncharacterized membrane protein